MNNRYCLICLHCLHFTLSSHFISSLETLKKTIGFFAREESHSGDVIMNKMNEKIYWVLCKRREPELH